jgi:hypothetical protein
MKKIFLSVGLSLLLFFGLSVPVQAASVNSGSRINFQLDATGIAAPLATSGAKYALCIGEEYAGTAWSLSCCDNDANLMGSMLASYGVNVTVDTQGITYSQVVNEIKNLVREAKTGGEIVFYYSGHGQKGKYTGSIPNSDNMNEAILLPDGNGGLTYLWDVDLAYIFSAVPKTCRCIFIFDSCHSGGMEELAGPNRIVIGACREESMCDEAAKYDCHGQFTYLFAEEAIQNKLANSVFSYSYSPKVSVEEAYDYVRMNEQSQVANIFDGIQNDTLF